jgi:AraC-like DNA-binding protein
MRESPIEWSRPVTSAALDGLELVHAQFTSHVFPLHAHAEYVIGAVLSGAKASQIGSRSMVAGPGHLTLFNPYEEHASAGIGDSWEFTALYPKPELVEKWFGPGVHLAGKVLEDGLGAYLIRRLYRILSRDISALEAETAFVETMTYFIERHGACDDGASSLGFDDPSDVGIRHARDCIDSEPLRGLSLAKLARTAKMQPASFLRAFRREYGCTPRVYATARRLALAKQALRAGQSLATVAADFGFCDQAHFTRVFHRWTGMTPKTFRRV